MEGNKYIQQRINGNGRGTGVSKLISADRDRLSELLGKELEILEQIHDLTGKQIQILSNNDIDELNSLLDKRQELIEKINGLHQDRDPLMQSYVSSEAHEKDSKIDELREQIQDLVRICFELNSKNIAAMKALSEEHTEKIDKQSAKRKGIGGYAQAVPNTPEVFDKKT